MTPPDADAPWPDDPKIPPLPEYDPDEMDDPFEPPDEVEIEEQNIRMLRRQRLFRWAAQMIANTCCVLPDVQRIAAFGAAARPLVKEVPRFSKFRRRGIKVLHECADLDLAIWVSGFANLKPLKNAMSNGLAFVNDTPYGGVSHHQVDVHLIDFASGFYRGRLCIFGQCPKQGKDECRVPGCGQELFLQQFSEYHFSRGRFESEKKVLLFDRSSRFLVGFPTIDGRYRIERLPGNDVLF